jgi:hypothetical protein
VRLREPASAEQEVAMRRRFVLGAAGLALGLGAVGMTTAGGGTASATPVPATFSGAIHCAASGSFKFSPKLANGPITNTSVTLRLKLTGCSGVGTSSGAVTLSGGHFVGTSTTAFPTACGAVLAAAALPVVSGTVTWKTHGGKAVTSTLTVSGATSYYNAGADTITTYLPTTITAGSYAGQGVTFAGLASNAPAYRLSQSCGAHGLGSLKFGIPGGTTTGTMTLGA